MLTKIKKPVSILLSLIMVFSMFAIVPLSASAAVGDYVAENDSLTFTAEQDGSSVTIRVASGSLRYKKNDSDWESYTAGTQINLDKDDYVRFRGKDTKFNWSNHVSLTGRVACSGNVMSLRLDDDGKVQGLASYCFDSMFSCCTGLTSAPELPETMLADYCYYYMFENCQSLTKAPALPATTLANSCYENMFFGCESLTELPALPATNLAKNCYASMFSGCESLTELPALPATALERYCYSRMFYDCSKICISDEAGTFGGITYSVEYRIPTTGVGTSATNALYDMFGYTGGKFTETPDINTTYYLPAPAPATFKAYVKKLTNETYTIENLTGETTVAQLKEIIADQIDIPATAQRLIFAGKQLEDAKTLAEYNIGNESTIHLVIRSYTVTWLNYDDSELGSTTVQYGVTPSYDGEEPTKEEDANNTYTFSGWSDGSNTYAADALPAVSGAVTYTAVYTADPKTPVLPDVIAGCTYYDSYWGVYANVPFAVNFSDIKDGAISFDGYYDTVKTIQDTKDYSYKFYDQTGTELEAVITESDDSSDTYGYRVIFNVFSFSNPISGPLYIVATEPAPAPVKYFIGHSITLGGDIGVNFFLDKTAYDNLSGTKTVKFAVDGEETTVSVPETAEDNGYKVTCDVVAARMAHKITATLYVDDEAVDTDEYSVQQYAEKIYANPATYDSEKPEQLKAVAEALLHYGAMAQTVFATSLNETPDHLADYNMPEADFSGATAENIAAAIKGSASDLNTAAAFDAEFYTSSLIYLSRNTLRLYFTPASKTVGALNALDFSGNLSEYYYFKDVENIPAAELDNQQSFIVNGTEFTYSALDYVKAVVESTKMEPEQKNLAKALFLYNQAANAYFDEPAPAQNIVDLSTLTAAYEAQDGDVLTGVLGGDYKITIAADATVTLKDVTITCLTNSANFAGITPLGDATIILEGTNVVKGGFKDGYADHPGIFAPVGYTLTIDGTGSLTASKGDDNQGCGSGIGGGYGINAGNIEIKGGNITAIGGLASAGIGSGWQGSCGAITITGGTVNATCGDRGAGIGSGYVANCGAITITGGTVNATGGGGGAGIGSGQEGSCGSITIAATVTQVTATAGQDAASIGAGFGGSCGTISIADPSKVTQN